MTASREREDSGGTRYGGDVLRDKDALGSGDLVAAGRYRIQGVLGRGGMATVYSAVRQRDGLPIALKVMKAKYAQRSDIEYRMRNEVELAAALGGHPNLVRPLDTGRLAECDDAPFLATELVHGPPLSLVVIMERPMPARRACTIALELARALEALHARGIVHRDVKPDNVMMVTESDREVVKLIDFGLASRIRAPHATSARVTEVFERPGTKHYMAPEQLLGKPAAPAMDVYALGCTMHEMLLGSPPFGQRSEDEVVARKLAADQPPFSMSGLRRDLPASLDALVDACLLREPEQRITLAALCEGLETVLAGMDGASTDTSGVLPTTRPSDPGDVVAPPVPAAAVAPVPAAAVAPVPADAVAPAVARPRRAWIGVAMLAAVVVAGLAWWRVGLPRDAATDGSAPATQNVGPSAVQAGVPLVEPTAPAGARVVASPAAPAKAPANDTPALAPSVAPVPAEAPPAQRPVDPTPAGEPAATPRPRQPAVPRESKAAADDAECKAVRAEAEAAARALDWPAALDKTAQKRCWPSSAERLRVRLQALLSLGRHEQCAREGKTSGDERVARITELCRRKMETP